MSKELQKFLLLRILLWIMMAIIGGYFFRNNTLSILSLSVILSIEVLSSLFVLWSHKKVMSEENWLIFIGFMDVIGITALIYFTGGIHSDFPFLYALSIAGLGIISKPSMAFFWALFSSIFYGVMVYSQFYGLLPLPPVSEIGRLASLYVLLKVILYSLFFFLVAAFVSFLSESIRKKSIELGKAERELRQLESDTFAILNNIPSGILAMEKNGKVLFSNFAAQRILNIKDNFDLDILKKKIPEFASELERILSKPCAAQRREIIIKGEEGTKRPIGLNHTYLLQNDGSVRGLIVVFQDLTEIKELEWELRRRDRLAAIGEFSAHLAHEIRNPLTALRGSVELLRDIHVDKEGKQLMDLILKESDRLNRIVSDFLQFARISKPRKEKVDISSILFRVVDWAKQVAILKKDVKIEHHLDRDEAWIIGDPDQIEMVFTNLFQNALDATQEGGKISILMAKEGEKLERLSSGSIRIPDGKIAIQVRDTGMGVDEDNIDHIFEPFFTTKREGTGLGLSIVQKIVAHHKGEVRVESKRGGGTVFTVFFPEAKNNG